MNARVGGLPAQQRLRLRKARRQRKHLNPRRRHTLQLTRHKNTQRLHKRRPAGRSQLEAGYTHQPSADSGLRALDYYGTILLRASGKGSEIGPSSGRSGSQPVTERAQRPPIDEVTARVSLIGASLRQPRKLDCQGLGLAGLGTLGN